MLTSKQHNLTLRRIHRYIAILNQSSENLDLEMRSGIWKLEDYVIIIKEDQIRYLKERLTSKNVNYFDGETTQAATKVSRSCKLYHCISEELRMLLWFKEREDESLHALLKSPVYDKCLWQVQTKENNELLFSLVSW